MCENNGNSMLLGDPAWQISSEESLGKLQVYERIIIGLHLWQMLSDTLSVYRRCLEIGVLKINIWLPNKSQVNSNLAYWLY